MHNKLTDRRFSYIHTRRIQNKVPKNLLDLVGSDPELECGNAELENIPRWEDDGGALFETCKSTPQITEMNSQRMQR